MSVDDYIYIYIYIRHISKIFAPLLFSAFISQWPLASVCEIFETSPFKSSKTNDFFLSSTYFLYICRSVR